MVITITYRLPGVHGNHALRTTTIESHTAGKTSIDALSAARELCRDGFVVVSISHPLNRKAIAKM